VASLNELISHLQQAVDQIGQAISAATAGEDSAGELQNRYASMDDEHKASMMAGIKDGTNSLRTYLQGGIDQGNQLIQQVEAAKGGG
jgi:hypothetical protein